VKYGLSLPTTKKRILMSILKLTKEKDSFLGKDLAEKALISKSSVLRHLKTLVQNGLLSRRRKFFVISPTQKIMIAVEAIKLGFHIDSVCRWLSWQDFERMVLYILEQKGYETLIHQRIKANGKIYEIDVLGIREDFILCIDCKHWKRRFSFSQLTKITKEQLTKVEVLSKNIKKIEEKIRKKLDTPIKILPVVVTLIPFPVNAYEKIPLVPVLKFNSFLDGIYGCVDKFAVKMVEETS